MWKFIQRPPPHPQKKKGGKTITTPPPPPPCQVLLLVMPPLQDGVWLLRWCSEMQPYGEHLSVYNATLGRWSVAAHVVFTGATLWWAPVSVQCQWHTPPYCKCNCSVGNTTKTICSTGIVIVPWTLFCPDSAMTGCWMFICECTMASQFHTCMLFSWGTLQLFVILIVYC